MVERKAFHANPKHQYRVSQCAKHDCSAHNDKNEDYYEYPSLTHLTDEQELQGECWKEKLFLQIRSINIVYPNVEKMIAVPIIKEWRLLRVSKFDSFHG